MRTKRYKLLASLVLIVGLTVLWYVSRPDYENLAKCLSSSNVTMYGTEWCSHCNAQKKMFGNSFQYINFIDCDINKDICDKEGINGYPTWDIAGHNVSGELKAATLSKLSGCPLK